MGTPLAVFGNTRGLKLRRNADAFTGRPHRRKRGDDETTIHRNLCAYLAIAHPALWAVTFHVPNGIKAASRTQVARLRGMGFKAGVVDLITLARRGRFPFLVVELKRAGERPTDAQLQFMTACVAEGGAACWADSFDKARAIYDRYAKGELL